MPRNPCPHCASTVPDRTVPPFFDVKHTPLQGRTVRSTYYRVVRGKTRLCLEQVGSTRFHTGSSYLSRLMASSLTYHVTCVSESARTA